MFKFFSEDPGDILCLFNHWSPSRDKRDVGSGIEWTSKDPQAPYLECEPNLQVRLIPDVVGHESMIQIDFNVCRLLKQRTEILGVGRPWSGAEYGCSRRR